MPDLTALEAAAAAANDKLDAAKRRLGDQRKAVMAAHEARNQAFVAALDDPAAQADLDGAERDVKAALEEYEKVRADLGA
jgi:tRNA 2-selenouridine synthase SelU